MPPSGARSDQPASAAPPTPPAPARQRWRLVVSLPAPVGAAAGEVSGGASWPALLAESGLPLARDAGGRGRAARAAPLALGVAGEREIVDVYLAERLPVAVVRAAVTAALPTGVALVDLHDVWVGAPAAAAAVVAADYRVLLAGPPRWAVEAAVLGLLGAGELPRERRRESKTTAYDLRPLVLRLAVRASGGAGVSLTMRLRHTPDAVGRPEEVVAALGEPPASLAVTPSVVSIVRERLVAADDADAPRAR